MENPPLERRLHSLVNSPHNSPSFAHCNLQVTNENKSIYGSPLSLRSNGLQDIARVGSVDNIATSHEQNKLISDAEISRQLGMIKEPIDPTNYNNNSTNDGNGLIDARIASSYCIIGNYLDKLN